MKIKNKAFLAGLLGVALSAGAPQAQIVVDVSGGIGTPLSINVLTGADFTPTTSLTGNTILKFQNFWDNSNHSFSTTALTRTVSLGGITDPQMTGGLSLFNYSPTDMVLGFSGVTLTSGTPLTLSPGARVTGVSLGLNYTAINPSGNVVLADVFGNPLSDPLTWTAVPEPSAYATVAGVGLAGLAAVRRFKKKANPAG